ncbi:hypothetical protein R3P38DRAFT_2982291 [Favolaschia claudopus]|uniref:Uncharacterized protein n=1 Tax=Favolaschia claudopus TaxID=2862362 RepID=A0AAW0AZ04_9AGAR
MCSPENPTFQQRVGHVNMMADVVLVNASVEDLRAILRAMLSSKTPGLLASFLTSTRARLHQRVWNGSAHDAENTPNSISDLFPSDDEDAPTPQLLACLSRARMLYGSGLGFSSLSHLVAVVRSTIGRRWPPEGKITDILVMVDADIAQGLQACREEIQGGGVVDYAAGRAVLEKLTSVLEESEKDVEAWGGEYPFERGFFSVRDFKL